jgi:hypothetical protein
MFSLVEEAAKRAERSFYGKRTKEEKRSDDSLIGLK